MSAVIISHIAFAKEKGRDPKSKNDLSWCDGYDCARRDNAAAMELMQGSLDKLRTRTAERVQSAELAKP